MSTRYFFFGTLMDQDVLQLVLDRPVAADALAPARLASARPRKRRPPRPRRSQSRPALGSAGALCAPTGGTQPTRGQRHTAHKRARQPTRGLTHAAHKRAEATTETTVASSSSPSWHRAARKARACPYHPALWKEHLAAKGSSRHSALHGAPRLSSHDGLGQVRMRLVG